MKLCIATAIASVVLATASTAFGQIEAQCPAGWQALPTPQGAEGQRTIAVCARDQMQIMAVQIPRPIPANDPAETSIAQQFASRMSESGAGNVAPFRTETVGGNSVRSAEITGTASLPDGTTAQVRGLVMFVPTTNGTVIVVGIAHDPHADVRTVERTFVGSMAGLSGPPPAWRASATCPAGSRVVPAESSEGPNGMRRVVRCESEAGMQLEVLESRLPVRTPEEARVPAVQRQRAMQTRLQMIGGTATLDATRPMTFGTTPGFITQIHASATDPRAPPGTSAAGVHIELALVIVPTSIGHVQIEVVSQAADANTLVDQMRTFVTQNLRLDGSGVTVAESAPGGDASSEVPAAPRHHEIDPDMPLWQPEPEAPPHATDHPDAHKSGCGCAVPGGLPPTGLAAFALSAAVMIAARRRRRIGRTARRS